MSGCDVVIQEFMMELNAVYVTVLSVFLYIQSPAFIASRFFKYAHGHAAVSAKRR